MKRLLPAIVFLFGLVCQGLSQVSEQKFITKYVYILVIDGPRYSETYGDPSCK
ncbi:MAG: hypothetical protein RIS89_272 [Bacteroidota bacterium]